MAAAHTGLLECCGAMRGSECGVAGRAHEAGAVGQVDLAVADQAAERGREQAGGQPVYAVEDDEPAGASIEEVD